MRHWIIMALAAGALSAVGFMSLAAPSLASVFLFYLAPLPLFMAGLAFGHVAAAMAALLGVVFTGATLGWKPAIFYLLTTGLAPAILSRLSLTSRPSAGGAEGEAADDAGREWYPEGRLLLWTAAMAGALMAATVLMLGPDLATFQATMRNMAKHMLSASGAAGGLDKVQLKALQDFVVVATPLVSTAMWEIAMLANMLLAAKLLSVFGYATRPWAPFWRLTFHSRAMLALATASVAAFLPGVFGLIGQIFAIALMTAYTILGLAVVHGLTLGNPWRQFMLGVLYVGLLLVNWLIVLPLIIIALADQNFGLRARYMKHGGGPPAKT